MKKYHFISVLIGFVCYTFVQKVEAESAELKTKREDSVDYRLLFVGNSLTSSNNLPKLVKEKARNKGILVETKMLTKGNYAIVDHWADGEVQRLIKSRKYDYVIIQQGPSSQQDGYDMLVNGGRLYSELCQANGAKLAYYMVWPSRRYYHTFSGVIANYTAGALANNAKLCPVGQVWKNHFDQTGDFSYYSSDQFHPSKKGSEVAAQVIVDSLFDSINEEKKMQQAWLTGVGNIEGNTINVNDIHITTGGVFSPDFNAEDIEAVSWGDVQLKFTSCHTAEMHYQSHAAFLNTAFSSGGYTVTRLAMNEAGRHCENENLFNSGDMSFVRGTFYGGSSRSGEGFNIDYLEDDRVIVSWYTYLPKESEFIKVFQ